MNYSYPSLSDTSKLRSFASVSAWVLAGLLLSSSQNITLAQTPVLDSLIELSVQHWPQLSRKQADLRSAQASQLEASRAFRPEISAGGTYTLAAGGRTIALPVGQLLNPVYGTLNQLTQSNQFPQIDDVDEQFLPNNFYDARIRVSMPLLRPEIQSQRKLSAAGIRAAEASIAVTEADLRQQVRASYYQLISAQTALEIYDAAEALLDEAYRTTASLVDNGAALPIARERIVAERAQIRADQAAGKAQLQNATAQLSYFVGVAIQPDQLSIQEIASPQTLEANRPELTQLNAALEVSDLRTELEGKYRRPRLSVQLDAGSQAFNFELDPYVLAGLSLNIPIYDGGRHDARTQRLTAEREAAKAQLEEVTQALDLQATIARNNIVAAEAELIAFAAATNAAERTNRDAQLLYRNGETGYIELLDAQNRLTQIRLQQALATYTLNLRYVDLLRALGQ